MSAVSLRASQVERKTTHALGALALLEDEVALERRTRRHSDVLALLAAPEGTRDGTQLPSNIQARGHSALLRLPQLLWYATHLLLRGAEARLQLAVALAVLTQRLTQGGFPASLAVNQHNQHHRLQHHINTSSDR